MINNEVKVLAGQHLNKVIKKQLESEDEINLQQQLFQVELFFGAIIQKNMKLSHRVQLGTCLANMLISSNCNPPKIIFENSLKFQTSQQVDRTIV